MCEIALLLIKCDVIFDTVTNLGKSAEYKAIRQALIIHIIMSISEGLIEEIEYRALLILKYITH